MKTFYDVLSDKRKAVPTPENIVSPSGKAYFGTFDKEFERMDFLSVDKPVGLPNFTNKNRLTLWEAVELHLKDIIVLTAVCDMGGLIASGLTIVYDKEKKKCSIWQELLPVKKSVISKNCLIPINPCLILHLQTMMHVVYARKFQKYFMMHTRNAWLSSWNQVSVPLRFY